jgi:dolichol kinase
MALGSYIVFALAAVSVALFLSWSMRRKEYANVWLIVATIVVAGMAAAVAYPQYLPLSGFFFLAVSVAAVSSLLPVLYRKKPMWFMLVIFVLAYAAAVSPNRTATVGMFGIGTVIGMLYNERVLTRTKDNRSMRKTRTEMERDMVQLFIGILVLGVALLWQQGYAYILFGALLIAYLFNNLISRHGAAYRGLSRFERKESEYGIGAMHLMAGFAILLGFASYKLALFGIFPLFFGDALATMTGMRFYRSRKLPYNRRKSYAGTIGFLIATAVPGVIILGLWGIPLALILTAVESIELPIDDNLAIPIATVIIGALAGI